MFETPPTVCQQKVHQKVVVLRSCSSSRVVTTSRFSFQTCVFPNRMLSSSRSFSEQRLQESWSWLVLSIVIILHHVFVRNNSEFCFLKRTEARVGRRNEQTEEEAALQTADPQEGRRLLPRRSVTAQRFSFSLASGAFFIIWVLLCGLKEELQLDHPPPPPPQYPPLNPTNPHLQVISGFNVHVWAIASADGALCGAEAETRLRRDTSLWSWDAAA